MDYNKLQKIIAEKSSVAEFCNVVGLGESGFYKMIKRQTMKLEYLEAFSERVNLPMAIWWDDDKKNIVNEHRPGYGLAAQIELLKDQLKDKERLIARLEKEIDRLEAKNHKTGDNDLVYAGTIQQNTAARMRPR